MKVYNATDEKLEPEGVCCRCDIVLPKAEGFYCLVCEESVRMCVALGECPYCYRYIKPARRKLSNFCRHCGVPLRAVPLPRKSKS